MEQAIASQELGVFVEHAARTNGASSVAAEPWVAELRGWKVSLEQAERANRNLLQHAAGIAALLGIAAGSGGVYALAEAINPASSSVEVAQSFPTVVILALFTAGAVLCAVLSVLSLALGILLVRAFRERHLAERDADKHLAQLIEARPDRFLPKGE